MSLRTKLQPRRPISYSYTLVFLSSEVNGASLLQAIGLPPGRVLVSLNVIGLPPGRVAVSLNVIGLLRRVAVLLLQAVVVLPKTTLAHQFVFYLAPASLCVWSVADFNILIN